MSAISILVNVRGKVRRLEFEPDIINEFSLRGCSYTTEDADIQKAVEHHKQFHSLYNDRIWIKGEPNDGVVEEATVEPVVEPVAEQAEEMPQKPKRARRIKKEEE